MLARLLSSVSCTPGLYDKKFRKSAKGLDVLNGMGVDRGSGSSFLFRFLCQMCSLMLYLLRHHVNDPMLYYLYSCLVISYRFLSFLIMSYRFLSFLIVSYRFSFLELFRITSHHVFYNLLSFLVV